MNDVTIKSRELTESKSYGVKSKKIVYDVGEFDYEAQICLGIVAKVKDISSYCYDYDNNIYVRKYFSDVMSVSYELKDDLSIKDLSDDDTYTSPPFEIIQDSSP